jgi:putative ABC transport system ATP-binding protein
MAAVIELSGVRKVYGKGEAEVRALDGVDITIERGDFVAIIGASGSGKSTMMNIIGCLDAPTAGSYLLDGINTVELESTSRHRSGTGRSGSSSRTST